LIDKEGIPPPSSCSASSSAVVMVDDKNSPAQSEEVVPTLVVAALDDTDQERLSSITGAETMDIDANSDDQKTSEKKGNDAEHIL